MTTRNTLTTNNKDMEKVKIYQSIMIEKLNTLYERVKDGDITPNQTAKDIKRIARELTKLNK